MKKYKEQLKEFDEKILLLKEELKSCKGIGYREILSNISFYEKEMLEYKEMNKPQVYGIDLNVPSGKIVIANNLRSLFPIYGSDWNVNFVQGKKQESLRFGQFGCAFFFVSNSCPSLYRINQDYYAVAGYGWKQKGKRNLYGICTDLWWYSIADYDEFLRRAKFFNKDPDQILKKFDAKVIKIKPGVWRFKHLYDSPKDFDGKYTDIRWIKEPQKPKDYIAKLMKNNYTAEQIVEYMANKGDYYPEPIQQQVISSIFCASSIDWHPNGYPSRSSELLTIKNLPSKPIEKLDKKYRWYPLSEYSSLCKIANGEIVPNESFIKLAFEVAKCISAHGSIMSSPSGVCYTDTKQREIATDCLEKLNKLYPDIV